MKSLSEIVVCPVDGISPALESHILEALAGHPHSPIWQYPEWTRMLVRAGGAGAGWYVGIRSGEGVSAFAVVEERSIGFSVRAGFCVGGPVIRDEKTGISDALSQALRDLSRREGWLFVQCEPLLDVELPGFFSWSYKRFIEQYTARIDTTWDEDAIFAGMTQKGRHAIRTAERAGVRIEVADITAKNIDRFYTLFSETTERDRFSGNSRWYFGVLLDFFAKTGFGELRFAWVGERLAAAGVFVYFANVALYYYGASSGDPALRKAMATYLLQWSSIREAVRRPCLVYDFLGIAPPDEGDHRLAGVTRFKRKFSKDITKWSDAKIFIARPVAYRFFCIARAVRRMFREN